MCKLHVVCLKLRGLLFKEFHTRRSSIVIVSTSWTQLRKRNYSLFLLYSWIAPGRVIPSMKAGSFCADLNKLFFNVEMILWISTSWMLTKLWTNLICYSNVTYSYFIQNFYNVYYLKWMNLSNNFAIKPKIITNRKKWKARFFAYTLKHFPAKSSYQNENSYWGSHSCKKSKYTIWKGSKDNNPFVYCFPFKCLFSLAILFFPLKIKKSTKTRKYHIKVPQRNAVLKSSKGSG